MDTANVLLVPEMKELAQPVFTFTLVVITFVLLWGLQILKGVLLGPDPANPKRSFIASALSQKSFVASADFPEKTDSCEPSSSHVGAAVGMLVLAVMLLGVGYYMLWSLFTVQSVNLATVGTYFLAGSALFAPYALDKLSKIFKP